MKKYFALILSAVVILSCFTACKAKLENGAVVTDLNGDNYAAVTEEGGGIVRDDAGNLVVLVTDENGKNVKGDDGEYQTNVVAIEKALVIGNRIECPNFALTIPSGWSDSLSYDDLVIKKDGTEDRIKIMVNKETPYSEVVATNVSVVDAFADMSLKKPPMENKSVTISENITAQFYSAFIEDTGSRDADGNIIAAYIGYITFEHSGIVYSCMITSNRDMTSSIDEVVEILGTIDFVLD